MGLVYRVSAHDNGAHFYPDLPDDTYCPTCGTCRDYERAPRGLALRPSTPDVSSTYDNRLLVSRRFLDLVADLVVDDFVAQVSDRPARFYVLPRKILQFVPREMGTRFIDPCGPCGGYGSIVGPQPRHLRPLTGGGRGLFRTDIPFASGREKFPLIFVDEEVEARIASSDVRGAILRPVRVERA